MCNECRSKPDPAYSPADIMSAFVTDHATPATAWSTRGAVDDALKGQACLQFKPAPARDMMSLPMARPAHGLPPRVPEVLGDLKPINDPVAGRRRDALHEDINTVPPAPPRLRRGGCTRDLGRSCDGVPRDDINKVPPAPPRLRRGKVPMQATMSTTPTTPSAQSETIITPPGTPRLRRGGCLNGPDPDVPRDNGVAPAPPRLRRGKAA